MSGPVDLGAYCRQVERYLCQRNGGHLIRVVGPAFERVRDWAERGVPIKVVQQGIDRFVERRQERGGSRRPTRIEFCEADVLDCFDEWKRAVGRLAGLDPFASEVSAPGADEVAASGPATTPAARGPSLPEHIARAQVRLSSVLSSRPLPASLRACLDDVLRQLEGWHAETRTARGERRREIVDGLAALDGRVAALAWDAQDGGARAALLTEAAQDLAPFRARLPADAWETTLEAAAKRLLRERLGLPSLSV